MIWHYLGFAMSALGLVLLASVYAFWEGTRSYYFFEPYHGRIVAVAVVLIFGGFVAVLVSEPDPPPCEIMLEAQGAATAFDQGVDIELADEPATIPELVDTDLLFYDERAVEPFLTVTSDCEFLPADGVDNVEAAHRAWRLLEEAGETKATFGECGSMEDVILWPITDVHDRVRSAMSPDCGMHDPLEDCSEVEP